MRFRVTVEQSGIAFDCSDRQTVLDGMRSSNLDVLKVGCRSGGCGVCRVQVCAGEFDAGVMSAAHVSAQDRALGIALACKIVPRSDLVLRATGRLNADVNDIVASLIKSIATPDQLRTVAVS